MMPCGAEAATGQPYPQRGRLAERLNCSRRNLRCDLKQEKAEVYCYVVRTIENRDERFVQRGSGPNWQGNVLTLCTCKHYLRSFRDTDAWPGAWLAGFTGVAAGGGRNALVFLTRVQFAFSSQADLWHSEALTAWAKRAKVATRNRHGDLFKPREPLGDPLLPNSYLPPYADHDHFPNGGWHRDIEYVGLGERRASMLVGDPTQTYLWNRPLHFFPDSLGRGQRKYDLVELLDALA